MNKHADAPSTKPLAWACRYDGFNESLETAATRITDAADDLRKPSGQSPSRSMEKGNAKDNFKTGMKVQPSS